MAVKENDSENARPQAGAAQDAAGRWFDVLSSMFDLAAQGEGPEKTGRLAGTLMDRLRGAGINAPKPVSTPYVNTIPVEAQAEFPGDLDLERNGSRASSGGTRWPWSSMPIANTLVWGAHLHLCLQRDAL